ncbi:MAG: hypothetical protein QM518_14010 [Verrucomicrobiota bacterium]|nr:hypothetical protein [Verrucomicrobiota bacterium]
MHAGSPRRITLSIKSLDCLDFLDDFDFDFDFDFDTDPDVDFLDDSPHPESADFCGSNLTHRCPPAEGHRP